MLRAMTTNAPPNAPTESPTESPPDAPTAPTLDDIINRWRTANDDVGNAADTLGTLRATVSAEEEVLADAVARRDTAVADLRTFLTVGDVSG